MKNKLILAAIIPIISVVSIDAYHHAILNSVVQPDGKRISVGWIGYPEKGTQIVVKRELADGSWDQTFAGGGFHSIAIGTFAQGRSVKILPNDKILIEGISDNRPVSIQLNSNGTRDIEFGNNGIIIKEKII